MLTSSYHKRHKREALHYTTCVFFILRNNDKSLNRKPLQIWVNMDGYQEILSNKKQLMVVAILLAALIAVWIEPTFSVTVMAKKSRSGEINLSGIPSDSSSSSSGSSSSSSAKGG